MSDNIGVLKKCYRKNVLAEQKQHLGLYTIPEYPEFQSRRGMWTTALDVILTTLRYLAPATLLTIFWGQQSFLFKLLKYIDSTFRSILYSSEEQKQTVLQWLDHAGAVRVDKLETVWRHGWIVCGVLDIAFPGACTGHPPTKLSLKHAQTIAVDLLGVEPMFTHQELESTETLGKHQEWKLITFLDSIRLSLTKLKPTSNKIGHIRFASETINHTFDYIAKGSGLAAAQINNMAYFKIYPTAQQSSGPSDIKVVIKGPKNAYGTLTIPAILGKAEMIRKTLLGTKSTTTYTESILPITQGATYLRTYGKTDMSKTYFIPQIKNNIEIASELLGDHVKVCYTVEIEGNYEISITSKNVDIAGSPFSMVASTYIVETLEKDNFYLEDGEEIDIVDITTDRKVVLRIIDFGTEKMILKENGNLEKISDDTAKQLMESNIIKENSNAIITDIKSTDKIASKGDEKYNHKMYSVSQEYQIDSIRHTVDIPDVVNSTFNEFNIKDSVTKCDRYIVPDNISVSLLTEKANKQKTVTFNKTDKTFHNMTNIESLSDKVFDDDSLEELQPLNNQFTIDTIGESYSTEKKFGSYITSEYETNKLQSEETQNVPTRYLIKEKPNLIQDYYRNHFSKFQHTDASNIVTNNMPFVDKDDSYIILNNETAAKDELHNQTHTTDFIIGARVTIPYSNIAASPDTLSHTLQSQNLDFSKSATYDKGDHTSNRAIHETNRSQNTSSNQTKIHNKSPNKEMWDSAYVSVDESNSPEPNECTDDVYNKKKLCYSKQIPNVSYESNNKNKQNQNRLPFLQRLDGKPESNYCKSSNFNKIDTDSVTEALSELDDIYDSYYLSEDSDEQTPVNRKTETVNVNVEIHQTINCDEYVNSASENAPDVKRHNINTEGKISEVQAMVTESDSVSQILQNEGEEVYQNYCKNVIDDIRFGEGTCLNIVRRRKIYWDEKIKQTEAKQEELQSVSKRRLSSKYLRRNDSLTKRRGKKIVQNYLNTNKKEHNTKTICNNQEYTSEYASPMETQKKVKLKESFKNCWDNPVNSIEMESCFGKKTMKSKENSILQCHETTSKDKNERLDTALQMKQELSEKVFEAFETSPKRFFGTSRKQILNKIDTFMEKSNVNNGESKNCTSNLNNDIGLVSSRISLFHTITNTESTSTSHRQNRGNDNMLTDKVSIHTTNILKEHKKSFYDENESNHNEIGNKFTIDQNANVIKEPIVSFQVEKLEDSEVSGNKYVDTSHEVIHKKINTAVLSQSGQDRIENKDNMRAFDISKKDTNHQNISCNNLKNLSKSEMDIFNKVSTIEIDLEKHKSCEELPNLSVKKFISIYEDFSKLAGKPKLMESSAIKRFYKNVPGGGSTEGTSNEKKIETLTTTRREKISEFKDLKGDVVLSDDKYSKHASCLSLSDIEIEIIEKPDHTSKSNHKTETEEEYFDYKNRFKIAKQYFKSLEDVRIEKSPNQHKEDIQIKKDIIESPDTSNKHKKKNNIKKSLSMPSSDISKIWNQMHDQKVSSKTTKKLVKISEKFNVEDLYEDVMEGRLSRQGSLRGIPNKKAVLETFRSMENVNDKKFNSYELATSHKTNFNISNEIKTAQTYLSEYPYLPTTDPSKYHSRLDITASGLITLKELKKMKLRRNSVPESTINPILTNEL